jgi:hypothetical protein
MQEKYRLYRRSNRARGTFYVENKQTGARESLSTKSKAEALRLLRAKNEATERPAFNREMAKVYLRAQEPVGNTCGAGRQTVFKDRGPVASPATPILCVASTSATATRRAPTRGQKPKTKQKSISAEICGIKRMLGPLA